MFSYGKVQNYSTGKFNIRCCYTVHVRSENVQDLTRYVLRLTLGSVLGGLPYSNSGHSVLKGPKL